VPLAGIDQATLAAYDKSAAEFAADWHAQPPPTDLHAAVRQYFRVGGLTADVGCGSGRDAAWLSENGYPCVGYDASEGLLARARERYPKLKFVRSALPSLSEIHDASFDNVLCETVIMHLPLDAVMPSIKRMLAILKPQGMLYLSWRVTRDRDQRDGHGRFYAAFKVNDIRAGLTGSKLLLDEEITSDSSGKTIHRLVARKDPGALSVDLHLAK
jgi:SAM-dependent methyltransferase